MSPTPHRRASRALGLYALIVVAFFTLGGFCLLLLGQIHTIQADRTNRIAAAQTANKARDAQISAAQKRVGALASSVDKLRDQVSDCADKRANAPGCTTPSAPPAITTIRSIPGAPGSAGSTGATGAQGAPGNSVTGPQGPPGINGADGASIVGPQGPAGTDGKDGRNGADGKDGANGTNGTNGTDGKPPASWTYVDALGGEHTCSPVENFDSSDPHYICN